MSTGPVQQPLVTEDETGKQTPIAPLHNLAVQYADLSSQASTIRQQLGQLKEQIAELMQQHEQTTYDCGGVEVSFTEPKVEIKVAPETGKIDTDAAAESTDTGGAAATPAESVH